MRRPWRLGIDIGGTFTDGILWNAQTGEVAHSKLLSTPEDPGLALLASVDRLAAETGAPMAAVAALVHGTTVATNAVLQRRLARTAFVTTKGFRDILEIARQVRPNAYDVFADKPPPLVPRHLCFEVGERLGASGEVVRPLDDASVEDVARRLGDADVQAVAICLLHAYRNPAHERRVAALLEAALPGVAIAASADLASEFREFPRACTTIINVGLKPVVGRYLAALEGELDRRGLARGRLVMQSNGGVADFASGVERPVHLIESGPAAGVVGAVHFASLLGLEDVISFDMGGTTAKVGMVREGRMRRVQEFEIGIDSSRSRNWNWGAAGYPILTPAIDLVEIGTGGGSLAWVDDGGRLRVGPDSAGAEPGPACYGRGGDRPTITDANLVLGRLDADYFLGGAMRLDAEAAERAVAAVAARVGLEPVRSALGIVQIANAAMSQTLRVVSVQRGLDPAAFALVAFGGAGPLHAVALAEETGIGRVLVPPSPGLASAFGLLVADLQHDFAITSVGRLELADIPALEARFAELADGGRRMLEEEGVAAADMRFERALDLRYVGQSHHLTIALGTEPLTPKTLRTLARRFNDAHLAAYGHAEASEPVELVNLRLSAIGRVAKPALAEPEAAEGAPVPKARRSVQLDDGPRPCAIYERAALGSDARIEGPAIVEEPDSTTLVLSGWSARVARFGVLVIERCG